MDENLQETAGSRGLENEKNRNHCFLTLLLTAAALSVIDGVIAGIARPNHFFSSTRYFLGEAMGTFITIYFFSLLIFSIVRLIRSGSAPLAGLGSGIAAALLLFAIGSHDDASLLVQHLTPAHAEGTGSTQR